jgi:hypothetical protein
MTKQRYLYWAKKNLTKILNPWDSRQLPNSVVCLDNLNIQHSAELLRLLRRIGCKVFWFAKYDPRLSPIERAFNQIKCFLRGPEMTPYLRRNPKLAIRAAMRNVSSRNARNFFRGCGLMPRENAAQHRNKQLLLLCMAMGMSG